MSQPYLLFGQSELKRLTDTLQPLAVSWAKQWLGQEQVHLTCLPRSAALPAHGEGEWLFAKSSTSQGIFLHRPSGFSKSMTRELFGDLSKTAGLSDTPSPLLGDSIQAVLLDLVTAVFSALDPSPSHGKIVFISQIPDPSAFAEGTGTVILSLQIKSINLLFLLTGSQCENFLRLGKGSKNNHGKLAPLENFMPIIQTKPIKVSAILGEAEIDIGTLQSISIGDVIRLDIPIDKPTQLFTSEGIPLCKGYLGARDEFKSLQLSR